MLERNLQSLSFLLFIVAAACAVAVHMGNRAAVLHAEGLLREGVTITTADDASYLVPAENKLAGKGWRANTPGQAAYVLRSPGYGMVYYLLRLALDAKGALWALFALQVLLFALATALLPSIGLMLNVPLRQSFAIGALVAVMPTFSGFLSYTLTEGMVPSLVVMYLYFILRSVAGSQKFTMVSALTLGVLILMRPPMLVWAIAFLPPLLLLLRKRQHAWAGVCILLAASPMMLWQHRGYEITGRAIGLHPIYHWDSNDLYRPIHGEIWRFHKMWGQTGVEFHRDMGSLWNAAMQESDGQGEIATLLGNMSGDVSAVIDAAELRNAYAAYYAILRKQVASHNNDVAMPKEPSMAEIAALETFADLRKRYVRAHPVKAWIAVPVRVYFQEMAAHSNLSLFMFQSTHRGKVWMEALRYCSLLLHVGLFVQFPLALMALFRFGFSRKAATALLGIALPVALYMGYLAFVQRGVEERYTLPMLVPMLLIVVATANMLVQIWRERSDLTTFAP